MTRNRENRGRTTAADLLAELEADSDFAARTNERQRELERKAREWRRAEAPLVEDLRAAGFDVESAWDLVNTATPYPEALPILLKHLPRPYPDRVREGIARALAVRDANFAWDVLKQLYVREPKGTDAKDGLAVAIAAAANRDVIDDVIALARDTRHGESRVLLLRALTRSRDPRARAALDELEADPELQTEVRRIRRRRRSTRR